jgi:YgiT-type zinc finger domain-containing protein
MVRWSAEVEARWQELTDEVITGMKEWRLQHPKATLREIEAALDERLNKVRARMLEDAALASAAADLSTAGEEERPGCPRCGGRLEAHGSERREVTTTGNQRIRLTRTYAVCPACGAGLFPPR